jgi:ubiquinone/menaquinone biosynthesis C-methylase UbiE
MIYNEKYYTKIAAAFIRGKIQHRLTLDCFFKPLEQLDNKDIETIFYYARINNLKLNRFKKTAELPRVKKVLGLLKGISPASLLDIGSGRGVFLWPLLNSFPDITITSIDLLDGRVDDIKAVSLGGFNNLQAYNMDASAMTINDGSFDAVSALEVLEHMENPEIALDELLRVTRDYIIISVPSKEDNNPEHIHFLTEKRIKDFLGKRGVKKVDCHYVLNHMIAVVKK